MKLNFDTLALASTLPVDSCNMSSDSYCNNIDILFYLVLGNSIQIMNYDINSTTSSSCLFGNLLIHLRTSIHLF